MRLLLDTHALLWWLLDNPSLPLTAREAISEPENAVFVSAASAWEIATKHRIGKLALADDMVGPLEAILAQEGFLELPISVRHGELSGSLAGEHSDPFDRMLIAQALAENLTLVSNEKLFDRFKVKRFW